MHTSVRKDRVMEQLLNEELGGERLPDLTQRILARTLEPRRLYRPLWRRPMSWAAAAAILVAVLIAEPWRRTPAPAPPKPGQVTGKDYPAPQAVGQFAIINGGRLERGKELATGPNQSASLTLGGYCQIELAADTHLAIAGQQRDEAVQLTQGEVTCQVKHGVGAFTVHTDIGDVHVTGTEFRVSVQDLSDTSQDSVKSNIGEKPMITRTLLVSVVTGAVVVSGPWGQMPVVSGQTKVIAPASAGQTMPTLESLQKLSGVLPYGSILDRQGRVVGWSNVINGSGVLDAQEDIVKKALDMFDQTVNAYERVTTVADNSKKEARVKFEAAVRDYLKANYDKMKQACGKVTEAMAQSNKRMSDYNAAFHEKVPYGLRTEADIAAARRGPGRFGDTGLPMQTARISLNGKAEVTTTPVNSNEIVKAAMTAFDEHLAKMEKFVTLTDEQKKAAEVKYEASVRDFLKTVNYDKMTDMQDSANDAQNSASELTSACVSFILNGIENAMDSLAIPPEAQVQLITYDSIQQFLHMATNVGGNPLTEEQKKTASAEIFRIMNEWDQKHAAEYARARKELLAVAATDGVAGAKFYEFVKARKVIQKEAYLAAQDAIGLPKR